MPFSAADEKDRQRRIRGAQEQRVAQPVRSEIPAWQPSWIPVVLRSVDAAAQEMWFHRLRYADRDEPVIGSYETYGPLERGYPFPTMDYSHYLAWIWPETIRVNEEDVDNPITTETTPLLATRDRGSWILMVPLKETTGATRGTYVFGGFGRLCPGEGSEGAIEDNDLYTPDMWVSRSPLLCPERAMHAATTIEGAIYSFAGRNGVYLQSTDEYVPDAWHVRMPMPPVGRQYSAAFALEGKGYVSGGFNEPVGGNLYHFDEYTPLDDTWNNQLQPLPRRTAEHAAFSLDNGGYVVGGSGQEGPLLDDTERYDPASGVWSVCTPLLAPGARHLHAAFVIDNFGYVVGGQRAAAPRVLRDVQRFDPVSGSWEAMQEMNSPGRSEHTAAAIGQAGFVHGGLDDNGAETDETQQYSPDPSGGGWSPRAAMPRPLRKQAAAATL